MRPSTQSGCACKDFTITLKSRIYFTQIIQITLITVYIVNYWLVKSEPDVFSYEQLVADGRTRWDGVRNYQARNNLRAMQLGDICLFYHSNIGLAVVGIARVATEYFPDPTAEKGDWSAVELEPYKAFNRPVPLTEIKANPVLENFGLVRNGRLSVMPASFDEFTTLLGMGQTQL